MQNLVTVVNGKSLELSRDTQAIEYLRIQSQSSAPSEVLPSNDSVINSSLRRHLWESLRGKRYIDHIRYIDKEGQEIIRVDREQYHVPFKNVENREYFQKALQLEPNTTYISPINLNREKTSGELEIPYKPTLRIACPIFNKNNEIEGIFVANILAEHILQTAHNSFLEKKYNMNLLIINSEGYFLDHPNSELEYGFEFKNQSLTLANQTGKLLWQEINKNNQGLLNNHKILGQPYIVIYKTVYLNPYDSTSNFKLVYIISNQYAFQKIRQFGFFSFGLGFISIVILVLTLTNFYDIELKNRLLEKKEEKAKLAARSAKQANKLKSHFLAAMSHEIRTPLNGIIGMTEILLRTPLSNNQKEYLQIVESSGQHLLGLINEILDLSKLEANEVEIDYQQFNLFDLIQETLASFQIKARQKNIKLTTSIASDFPDSYVGDAFRLRQILTNLISNALKFTEEGEVIVEVSTCQQDCHACQEICEHETSSLFKFNNPVRLQFAVRDTGIGISKEAQARIFSPFSQADKSTQRKYGGTGLGLSISSHLAKLMKGDLTVKSVLGQGSEFRFTVLLECLPDGSVSQQSIEKKSLCSSHLAEVKAQVKILVAEDNIVNQKVALNMLKKLGFSADIAIDGQEAIKMLKTKQYDLIFMDIQMPEMDGYEATCQIRLNPQWHTLPIIALSASAMKDDSDRCLEAGMNDFLSKPIKMDDLRIALDKWLDIKSIDNNDIH